MGKIDKGDKGGIPSRNTRIGRVELSPPSLCPAADLEGMTSVGAADPAPEAGTAPLAPEITLGGLRITAVDRQMAATLLISAAHRRGRKPFYSTSANGEVIARVHADRTIAQLFLGADQILADGQPLVFASRWLCRQRLPERVATTDLFHDVARIAERERVSFYLFGAGGLFDHLAGKTPRAPLWMQRAGFEWLWRVSMEPRRLFWRYVTTNPRALYVLLRHSQ